MDDEGIVVTTVDTPATAEPVVETPAVETPVDTTPKTFTQDELDKQIGRRLAREQAKYQRDLQAERETRIRLEERLAQHTPKSEAAGAEEPEPTLEGYDDFMKFQRDHSAWTTKREIKAYLAETEKKQSVEKANAAQQQSADGWNKKVSAVLKEIPDYYEVVSESTAPLTGAMKSAITESDQGPQLAYYLATHADEAQRIAGLTPIGAVRALTLIEAGFKSKPTTQTPEPVAATGSRQTSGVKALTDIKSQSEWDERRRKYIANRR